MMKKENPNASFEKEKIGLIGEEDDHQRRVSIISPELEDGFNLNEDDEYLNQQFSRRKDSQFVESSKKIESKIDSLSEGLSLKIEKLESFQETYLTRFEALANLVQKMGVELDQKSTEAKAATIRQAEENSQYQALYKITTEKLDLLEKALADCLKKDSLDEQIQKI